MVELQGDYSRFSLHFIHTVLSRKPKMLLNPNTRTDFVLCLLSSLALSCLNKYVVTFYRGIVPILHKVLWRYGAHATICATKPAFDCCATRPALLLCYEICVTTRCIMAKCSYDSLTSQRICVALNVLLNVWTTISTYQIFL